MRRVTLMLALAASFQAVPALAQELKIDRHVLGNGLTVYTHEEHSAPLMSFYVFYNVGSVNEHLGITGISHLFEHMMFNGSAHVKPKEFDFKLEAAGGSSNGYTVRDYTAYTETFPPEAIDLILELESDRMASMTINDANLEQERGIVKEERRLRTDNDNGGKLDEILWLQAFTAHPYRNPVVGFMEDLNNIKLQDVRNYFDTYYTPNNAVVVVTGDFSTPELMKKIEKSFANVKKGPEVPRWYGFEPVQAGERRAVVRRDAELPMVMTGWHAPGANNQADVAAVDIALSLLGQGDSSRLYQSLVAEQEVAVGVQAWCETLEGDSLAVALLQVAPGKDPARAEEALYAQIDALIKEPIPEAEVQKARNQQRAGMLRQLKTVDGWANMIGYHAMIFGDPMALGALIDARDKVTAADVKRVLKQYFTRENRTVVTLIPQDKAPAGAGDTQQAQRIEGGMGR